MGVHSGYRPSLDATVATDEFAPYNVLLVNGSNYVSATQNNTFLDSSSNRFAITRNGNATQGSFSPYGSTWSNYFDGSGDYLSIASNAAFAFGTGTFTIEGWIYITVGGQIQFMISSDNTSYWAFGVNASNQLIFRPESSTTNEQAGTTALALNTWHHIAAVREGTGTNQFKMYLNGVLEKTGTVSTNYSVNTGAFISSGRTGNNNVFNGYISNVRVVKGTAVYTAAFTPPTEPLTAVTNTSLLTCHANRFLDGSTNNFTVTKLGDSRIVKDSPFQLSTAYNQLTLGGSSYFDGTGDYLSIANNTALDFGSGSFTIEMWVNFTSFQDGKALISKGWPSLNSPWLIYQDAFNNKVAFYASSNGSSWDIANGVTVISGVPALNTWYHIAIVRSGNTFYVFNNGVQISTFTSASTVFSTTQPVTIGGGSSGSNNFVGYISDVRLIKGTAVYTSNFTPPSAPLTAITNTSLLTSFTNAAVIDQTGENVLETLDGAQVSRTQSKFENAVYFDGSGDYLSVPSSQGINLSSGNWTIESWVWWSGNNSQSTVLDKDGVSGSTYPSYAMGVNGSGYARIVIGAGNVNGYFQIITSNTLLPTSTWVHLAAVKNGSTITLYQNGVSVASATQSGTIVDGGKALLIGYSAGQPTSSYWSGYIDDLRITRGVARYTANFTPPARALPITRFG